MILTNIETVPGKRITKHLGLVQGSTVRAKHAGRDIFASLKNIFGGELKAYTELMQESRDQAAKRMTKQAEKIGANAVINVRFATSSVAQGAAELFIYGTAVVVEDDIKPIAASPAPTINRDIASPSQEAFVTSPAQAAPSLADPDAPYRKPSE